MSSILSTNKGWQIEWLIPYQGETRRFWLFPAFTGQIMQNKQQKCRRSRVRKNSWKISRLTLTPTRIIPRSRTCYTTKGGWSLHPIQFQLLQEFHTTLTRGHAGVFRTYRRIAQSLYWRGIMGAVTQFVAKCHVCWCSKYIAASPHGLLRPLPIPDDVWEEISMDVIILLLGCLNSRGSAQSG